MIRKIRSHGRENEGNEDCVKKQNVTNLPKEEHCTVYLMVVGDAVTLKAAPDQLMELRAFAFPMVEASNVKLQVVRKVSKATPSDVKGTVAANVVGTEIVIKPPKIRQSIAKGMVAAEDVTFQCA
mmetsp:Transcript_1744/g.2226  ORF Transcript_1744/g.2226 Transcript_1744/m.2226 type:complete len:125 (-) Transcript_1744:634-1008(-)|eukprot:CAMPEP_0204895834 /NCGR_PEP_ID=MMETSP1349-20130617/34270_1 /ASSEMBLY_ACC=CAM_ASM_000710 /TAXON_ID=215587 /ORGANISM="Aplanochytrium stocchinoi, Strain GSBS06" /LENGTH=124 /DNA_ID=CAMNT_0052063303 /DNA_START=87 /DNA_END=461 /DNA_ORIENTATION=-